MKQISTVNLRKLKANDPGEIKRLGEACRHWGFFRLIELDLREEAAAKFLAAMRVFFDLPHVEKKQLSRTEANPWGYFDEELTKNKQDWKEIFDLNLDRADPGNQNQTPWPPGLQNFRATMLHWHQLCEAISLILLESITLSLRLPKRSLSPHFTNGNSSFLRLNHYPVCAAPADSEEDFPAKGHLGIYHHTDAGAITILLQDKISGLQVRHNGSWETITNENDSLIVNVGDLVQVWSNDQYKAPLHRVLANSQDDRFSAAFFMNPTFSTNCIPKTSGKPLYRPLNWGEFRSARAAGDYANLGNETQISDYRVSR